MRWRHSWWRHAKSRSTAEDQKCVVCGSVRLRAPVRNASQSADGSKIRSPRATENWRRIKNSALSACNVGESAVIGSVDLRSHLATPWIPLMESDLVKVFLHWAAQCRLAPVQHEKHTGQESGGELCGISKFWSSLLSQFVTNVCKLFQLLGDLRPPGPSGL